MNNLIPFDQFCKENFTESELEEIEKVANKRIAIRRLKELREEENISQTTLAKKSGLPRTTISMIETGKRNVSISKLIQIANALDRDLEIRFVKKK
jgi:DNA-binding XRE family transcriptional regulator